MPEFAPHYLAYLLRLWRDSEHTPWRAQLEDPHTGETIGFSSLAELFAFLTKQTNNNKGQDENLR